MNTHKHPPINDWEAWLRFPKHNHLYSTTRLLDAQNVEWCPFPHETADHPMPVFNVSGHNDQAHSNIYVRPIPGESFHTVLILCRGRIVAMYHIDQDGEIHLEINGRHTIRCHQFALTELKDFTGGVTLHVQGAVIVGCQLLIPPALFRGVDPALREAHDRLYRRRQWRYSGSITRSNENPD